MDRESNDSYRKHNDEVHLIKTLLTELIFFQEFGRIHTTADNTISITDSDNMLWMDSRLRQEIVMMNETNSDCNCRINVGLVLFIACQRLFEVFHVEEELTNIEQIVPTSEFFDNTITERRNNDNNDIPSSNDSNLYVHCLRPLCTTMIIVPEKVQWLLVNEFPHSTSYVHPYCGRTVLHLIVNSFSGDGNIVVGRNDNNNDYRDNDRVVVNVENTYKFVHTILKICPIDLVRIADGTMKTPLDLLAAIILMKEELVKYSVRRSTIGNVDVAKHELDQTWECIRIVINGCCRWNYYRTINSATNSTNQHSLSVSSITYNTDDDIDYNNMIPILHGCLQINNIPLSLVECAIRRFGPTEIERRDTNGNLPLHLVSSKYQQQNQQQHHQDDEEDNDDDNYEIMEEVLKRYPDAVQITNKDGMTPFDVAVRAGRRWETGIELLLTSYPKCLSNYLLFSQHHKHEATSEDTTLCSLSLSSSSSCTTTLPLIMDTVLLFYTTTNGTKNDDDVGANEKPSVTPTTSVQCFLPETAIIYNIVMTFQEHFV